MKSSIRRVNNEHLTYTDTMLEGVILKHLGTQMTRQGSGTACSGTLPLDAFLFFSVAALIRFPYCAT